MDEFLCFSYLVQKRDRKLSSTASLPKCPWPPRSKYKHKSQSLAWVIWAIICRRSGSTLLGSWVGSWNLGNEPYTMQADTYIITRLDIHQNLIFNENLKESQRFRLRCHTRTPITMWICTAFLLTTWFPLFPSSKRSKALHLKAGDCPLQARIILLHGDIRESLNQ